MTGKLSRDGVTVTLNEVKGTTSSMASFASLRMTQGFGRVHMMVGNHDEAVELLKDPVTLPNNVSKAWLRVDPTWDPLRKHPGFQRLVGGD